MGNKISLKRPYDISQFCIPDSSIDHFIEDFFNINQEPIELWPPNQPTPKENSRNFNKIRLNSYEESLSSPESVFSIRY